jgi:hypothetical protein
MVRPLLVVQLEPMSVQWPAVRSTRTLEPKERALASSAAVEAPALPRGTLSTTVLD